METRGNANTGQLLRLSECRRSASEWIRRWVTWNFCANVRTGVLSYLKLTPKSLQALWWRCDDAKCNIECQSLLFYYFLSFDWTLIEVSQKAPNFSEILFFSHSQNAPTEFHTRRPTWRTAPCCASRRPIGPEASAWHSSAAPTAAGLCHISWGRRVSLLKRRVIKARRHCRVVAQAILKKHQGDVDIWVYEGAKPKRCDQ